MYTSCVVRRNLRQKLWPDSVYSRLHSFSAYRPAKKEPFSQRRRCRIRMLRLEGISVVAMAVFTAPQPRLAHPPKWSV